MPIHEVSFEATKQFCAACTQDDVINLINAAIHRIICFKERLKAVHLTDIAYRSISAFAKQQVIGEYKSLLIISGSGTARDVNYSVPLLPGVLLLCSGSLDITAAESGLVFYEGAVDRISK